MITECPVRVLYELFNKNVALQGFEAQELNREINITPSSMVAETAHMNSSRIAEMDTHIGNCFAGGHIDLP